jgi:hypothetical protein
MIDDKKVEREVKRLLKSTVLKAFEIPPELVFEPMHVDFLALSDTYPLDKKDKHAYCSVLHKDCMNDVFFSVSAQEFACGSLFCAFKMSMNDVMHNSAANLSKYFKTSEYLDEDESKLWPEIMKWVEKDGCTFLSVCPITMEELIRIRVKMFFEARDEAKSKWGL